MSSLKPKIYVLFMNQPVVKPTSGDIINEIMIYKVMSLFADVYYNNQLFQPNKINYGLTQTTVTRPTRRYDLYYLRNNYDMWKTLPNPKISTALPVNKEVFQKGKGVVVFTEVWREWLQKYPKQMEKMFYKKVCPLPNRVICFPQAFDNIFKPLQSELKTKKIRDSFNADFIISYFGRISREPEHITSILTKLKDKYKNKKIKAIFAGSIRDKSIKLRNIDYIGKIKMEDMPYYLSASDVFICNYTHTECNFYGSRHTIECMATGLPIICGNFMARKEMLGEDYPLYWDRKNTDQIFENICKLIDDKDFFENIRKKIIERSKTYSIKYVSEKFKKELSNIIKI